MRVYKNISDFKEKKTAITIGVFDGVHEGHKSVIKKLLDISKTNIIESVVFTLWPHPQMVIQPENQNLTLLNSINEKIELLQETGVDHLILYPFTLEFSKFTSCEFIKKILVDKLNISNLIVGFNHHFGHKRGGNYNDLVKCAEEYNFEIERLEPFLVDDLEISSTFIRNSLIDGNLDIANKYLGYKYFLSGKVVSGSKIGRSIGFPTANIKPEHKYKLIPKDGVYAVRIDYEKKSFKGMLNIGLRPTVNNSTNIKRVEVHIFNFDKVIYDKEITVHFVKRIRDEIKFKDLNQLQKQLEIDKKNIEEILE